MSVNGYLEADLEVPIGYLEAFASPGRTIFSVYRAGPYMVISLTIMLLKTLMVMLILTLVSLPVLPMVSSILPFLPKLMVLMYIEMLVFTSTAKGNVQFYFVLLQFCTIDAVAELN